MKQILIILLLFGHGLTVHAQGSLLELDTTQGLGRVLLGVAKRYDHLRISGYLQPQFQFIDTAGARTFGGGDFAPHSNNRFMLRRGRIRLDYSDFDKSGRPILFFVFQFDGTERAFVARDFWGRVFENRWECFALTIGIMARPLGQELLWGSNDRESPERGRMSQLLTRTERDLGAMITFEPRRKNHPLRWFKWDLMLANGQGLTGPNEFDSHKDIVSRISLKSRKLSPTVSVTGGIYTLYGGIRQPTATSFRMVDERMQKQESPDHVGRILPRQYYGADAQLKIRNRIGITEFRAEYMQGWQTGTASSSETPGTLPTLSSGGFAPLYARPFAGVYGYWLQHLGSLKHQILVKYDRYDPNTHVSGKGLADEFTGADVAYQTLGLGYVHYFNINLRMVFYYEIVKNELTQIAGFQRDVKDNLFTARLHFRF